MRVGDKVLVLTSFSGNFGAFEEGLEIELTVGNIDDMESVIRAGLVKGLWKDDQKKTPDQGKAEPIESPRVLPHSPKSRTGVHKKPLRTDGG